MFFNLGIKLKIAILVGLVKQPQQRIYTIDIEHVLRGYSVIITMPEKDC